MIKVEVVKEFTLGRFDEIKKTIVRKGVETPGKLNVGDTFECTKELANYLMGKNDKNEIVVKVIEIIPQEEPKVEEKPKKKTTK